jgi:hypothetical protein
MARIFRAVVDAAHAADGVIQRLFNRVGGLPRGQAEARAFACCAEEWLNRNPVRSPPGRCLGFGGGDHAHDPLSPCGMESTGHAWLHSRCWPARYASRKAEAVAALAAIGIAAPSDLPDDFGKNGGA